MNKTIKIDDEEFQVQILTDQIPNYHEDITHMAYLKKITESSLPKSFEPKVGEVWEHLRFKKYRALVTKTKENEVENKKMITFIDNDGEQDGFFIDDFESHFTKSPNQSLDDFPLIPNPNYKGEK